MSGWLPFLGPANIRQDGHGHLLIKPVKAGGSWTSGRIETIASKFAAPAGGELKITASIDQPPLLRAWDTGQRSGCWAPGSGSRGPARRAP